MTRPFKPPPPCRRPSVRKIWVIAGREYNAAVRTKAFIISLVIMPVLMGGSILVQALFRDVRDIRDKKFVLIDRANRPDIVKKLIEPFDKHNESGVLDSTKTRQMLPRFIVDRREATPMSPEERDQERFELSEKVRHGEIVGFAEIISAEKDTASNGAQLIIRYQSNNPTYTAFAQFLEKAVGEIVRQEVAQQVKLDDKNLQTLVNPVKLESKGLSKRDAQGNITEGSEASRITSFLVPFVLMMLMFMTVMMTATPLMQGVVEEKMQRISEVLLGSVPPFELMMGKLIGMTGVSLTIAAVYLGGGYWTANYFGVADAVS